MNDLYLNTPLTKAIFEAFKELSVEISFILEDAAPGSCRAYVFGGAAVHIYTNARGSGDIDTELQAAQKMELEEIIIRYEDEEGNEQSVSIDPNFSTGISGMLADDYQECAVPLMIDKAAPLHVYLVSPLHLAVHKLDRLAEGDQDDIISLASAGRISAETL
ncbi:DUF6036 family nucleotidyltransferase [Nitrincola alkalisediminis]|uniref:DUF6036 family nucleotidyltransferase n=1 Tax=Nitrincola alkalisediminis TaxID=1366656 RepID=UPI001876D1BC|nr:DUF6036 family nucleotidyltransferase [Nitrincola alkalisediminis]